MAMSRQHSAVDLLEAALRAMEAGFFRLHRQASARAGRFTRPCPRTAFPLGNTAKHHQPQPGETSCLDEFSYSAPDKMNILGYKLDLRPT